MGLRRVQHDAIVAHVKLGKNNAAILSDRGVD